MNTRLEIASRAMAGVLFDHNSIGDYEAIANEALAYADALIKLEAETRPPTSDESRLAQDLSDAAHKAYIDKLKGGSK